MQGMTDAITAGVGAVQVAGLVALIRARAPKVDGAWVLVVALVAGVGLALLTMTGSDWRGAIVTGLQSAVGAVGIMSGVGYAAGKAGAALGSGPVVVDTVGVPVDEPKADEAPKPEAAK